MYCVLPIWIPMHFCVFQSISKTTLLHKSSTDKEETMAQRNAATFPKSQWVAEPDLESPSYIPPYFLFLSPFQSYAVISLLGHRSVSRTKGIFCWKWDTTISRTGRVQREGKGLGWGKPASQGSLWQGGFRKC